MAISIHSKVDESVLTKVLDPLSNIAMARVMVGVVAQWLQTWRLAAKFADFKQKEAPLSPNVLAFITFI